MAKRPSVNTDSDDTSLIGFSASAIIDRLRDHAGAATDADFARKRSIPRTTLVKWRARNTVPLELVARFALEDNLSLDWIMLGRGPKRAESSLIPASRTALDENLLRIAVEALDGELGSANLRLPGEKFARVVVHVYALLSDHPARAGELQGHVRRALRLVV